MHTSRGPIQMVSLEPGPENKQYKFSVALLTSINTRVISSVITSRQICFISVLEK